MDCKHTLGQPRRAKVAWLALLSWLAIHLSCGGAQDAVLLAMRVPGGLTGPGVRSYSIQVQDRKTREVIYRSGSRAVDAGRDLAAQPLRVGLQMQQTGTYLVVVLASSADATSSGADGGAITPTGARQFFFAGIYPTMGAQEVDALLLPVDPADDADGDHFPDADTWPKSQPQAQALYAGHPEVLDCVDKPARLLGATPASLLPGDFQPLAKVRCGVKLRPAGAPTGTPADFDVTCAGQPVACVDNDKDGELSDTDCDDSDPLRFHGNPRPRNCCQCTDRQSCLTNHAKRTDLSVCQSPARCGTLFDYDCTGQDVDCFTDNDCDGFSPDDPNPKLRDCNDQDARVYPGAPKNCQDQSKDWACDGHPEAGCVPCDLDGDGYQRLEPAAGCPDAKYVASGMKVDCADDDRGVFPGSTSTEVSTRQILHDLKGQEGGSGAAALRQLCANKSPDGTDQDADCDGAARKGCPPATAGGKVCDADKDGFPNSNAGCNPDGLPLDCNDGDAHIFPGAPDLCGDGKAQDCVADHACAMGDLDGDGYAGSNDCDDGDAKVHPWAAEVCNGKDDDCDGLIDELNPDDKGAAMVQTVSGKSFTLTCTDSNVGECGKKAPSGGYFGRCVCTGQDPKTSVNAASRSACPGVQAGTAVAPKCFGATQPTKQTCDADNPRDDDCDGKNDDPTGANLAELGQSCGVSVGQCKAGMVIGCDRTKVNPFSRSATPPRSVAGFDEKNRFLLCDVKTVFPVDELCNGMDDDCDGKLPGQAGAPAAAGKDESDADKDAFMACTGPCPKLATGLLGCGDCNDADNKVYPSAPDLCDGKNNACAGTWSAAVDDGKGECAGPPTTPTSCCTAVPMCIDLTSSFNFCGSCAVKCSNATADRCASSACKCGGDAACSGVKPVCKAGAGCVECLKETDCAAVAGRTHCETTASACVQCLTFSTDCDANLSDTCTGNVCKCNGAAACVTGSAAPYCHGALGCTQCVTDPHCAGVTGKTRCGATGSCVQCTSDTHCAGVTGKTHCSATGTCVQCTSDTQCAGVTGKNHCSAAGVCVECNTAAECPAGKANQCTSNVCKCEGAATCSGATPYCLAGTGCVTCASDTDCASKPATPVCKVATGQCVQCNSAAECPAGKANQCTGNVCKCEGAATCSGATPYCLAGTGCVTCASDTDCASKPATPVCKVATGQCVQCNSAAADCSPTAANECTGNVCKCEGASTCSGATPYCLAGTGCTECKASLDCAGKPATPVCKVSSGSCVQCVSFMTDCNVTTTNTCTANACKCDGMAACSGATPYCLTGFGCTECKASLDCAGKPVTPVCKTASGSCVQCVSFMTDCSAATANACTGNACKCDDMAACSGATPFCLGGGAGCVGCRDSGDCAGKPATPVCKAADHTCVQCVDAVTDCNAAKANQCNANVCECEGAAACSGATPFCLGGTGCVECRTSADCPMAKPTCDTMAHTCS